MGELARKIARESTIHGRARRHGPDTQKEAAKSLHSARHIEVLEASWELRRKTGSVENLIDVLLEWTPKGKKLVEDSISGMVDTMGKMGIFVTTGKKVTNKTGKKAMAVREATDEETIYIRKFVGPDPNNAFPSATTFLKMKEVRRLLKQDPFTARKLAMYDKGVLYKVDYKNMGIGPFMRKFDTRGRIRDDWDGDE